MRQITLDEALRMARENSPELQGAIAAGGAARAARLEARSVLLPNLNAFDDYIYTQPNSAGSARFIGSNGIREYVAQAIVHEQVGVADASAYRSAAAGDAAARAGVEIASRGLVLTVVSRYDAVVVAGDKLAVAQQAEADARQFLEMTQRREAGGEAAHVDVIKAQLQLEQRQRERQDADLIRQISQSELAVVILPDYDASFSVADDLTPPAALPAFDVVQADASRNNPDVAAAEAALREAHADVWTARGQMLPSLSFDYFYGIDASRHSTSTDGVRNLGYSFVTSVRVPLWNWGASFGQVSAARLNEQHARVALSFVQRQLIANLHSFYGEASTARAELDSLDRSVALAAEALRLSELRYQAGEATVLEVVDAQATLVDARNRLADGRARYHLALATLQTLTGHF